MKILSFSLFLLLFIPTAVWAKTSPNLDIINQKVCDRFETDVYTLSAIMDEKRDRLGIKETRVAYGGIDTKVKAADYWITYAAEAISYQRSQKYSSKNELKGSLEVLKGKILKAKNMVKIVLEDD